MNTETKLLYGLGLIATFLLIAYGLFPQYDQIRLALVAVGIPLGVIVVISWGAQVDEEDKIKKMHPLDLQKIRPDLMIASKLTVDIPELPEAIPETLRPAPQEKASDYFQSNWTVEMVDEWKKNKFYRPGDK